MYLTYEATEVEILVEFEGGSVAREARVTVYSPDGAVYLEGVTDEEGTFRFQPEGMEGEWKISAEHTGHKTTVSLGGSQMESGSGLELPLAARIAAGFGYLVGILGIALLILDQRNRMRSRSHRLPEDR
jgi:nickel transport protein